MDYAVGGGFGGGFGPSSGKLVTVCESSEARLTIKTKSVPPAIGALVFAVSFLGILSGMTLMYLDNELLGTLILTATVVIVASMIIWAIRLRR